MNDAPLSAALEAFLRSSIDNYDQLLILLCCYSRPSDTFVSPELARELRCDERVAAAGLSRLHERKLLRVSGLGYRAAEDIPWEVLAELSRVHDERPRQVQEFLVGLAMERLRVSNIVSFADAFRLRGGKKDG